MSANRGFYIHNSNVCQWTTVQYTLMCIAANPKPTMLVESDVEILPERGHCQSVALLALLSCSGLSHLCYQKLVS